MAFGSRTAEEPNDGRTGPLPALTGGDTRRVEMLGNGLRRRHSCPFGSIDVADEPPHERLDILSQLRQPVNSPGDCASGAKPTDNGVTKSYLREIG